MCIVTETRGLAFADAGESTNVVPISRSSMFYLPHAYWQPDVQKVMVMERAGGHEYKTSSSVDTWFAKDCVLV